MIIYPKKRNLLDRENQLKISKWKNLPEGFAAEEPLFVFTDIHACYVTLRKLLKALPEDARPVFLGDAIDNGMDPIETLQLLMELKERRQAVLCRGGHDALAWYSLLKVSKDLPLEEEINPLLKELWMNTGGTLTSQTFKSSRKKNPVI